MIYCGTPLKGLVDLALQHAIERTCEYTHFHISEILINLRAGVRGYISSLYAMVKRGALQTPIIGVAFDDWPREQLIARARDAVANHLDKIDEAVFEKFAAQLTYVSGDYRNEATFEKLRTALGGHQHPLYYLAIPPSLFETVVTGLNRAGIAASARLMVEKPFGRDLASAEALNEALHAVFAEDAIFRIDHFLGKEAIQNLLYFRFASQLLLLS